MGNFGSSKHKEQLNTADWTLKEKLQASNIWSFNADPNMEIQQYVLNVHDEKSFQKERQMYFLRKNHPQLVATKFFKDQSEGDFCGSVYKGKLYLERIPLRLSVLKDIPFPDVIHFLNQTLRGGETLAKQYKPFITTEQHIGVNQQGIVKIWQNVQYEKTFPSENYCDEEIMVRKILQIVNSNTQYRQLPPDANILDFFYQQRPSLNFNEALRKLDQYTIKYNNGRIPQQLDCVSKVGGINVLTKQQKAYQERSRIGQPIMVNQSIISQPPLGGSRNMTQIPRQQTVVYPQNSTIIKQYQISQISKPESVQLRNSQAGRPTSPHFIMPQVRQNRPPQGTIIEKLAQPYQMDRVKVSSSSNQIYVPPNKSLLIKPGSPTVNVNNQFQTRAPTQRVMTTQSAYPMPNLPESKTTRPHQPNLVRQEPIVIRNSQGIRPQEPVQRIQVTQSEFKPLSPQQVTTGIPIQRVQGKKKTQASQFRTQHQEMKKKEVLQGEQMQKQAVYSNNPPIKFVRMASNEASISQISSINPVNQIKKSYYTSEKPFSQLRGESINNTTVNFYNNYNPDSQAQWQQRPNTSNTGNKNTYQNVYQTIPQQLKQQRDYIHESPANSGSAGTYSFGNQRKDLKDGTSSQDFLAQLRTFKSYSPQKKQIQKQYHMLNQQQKMRQQQRQRQAEQRQRQLQQQIQLQGMQFNPKIAYSSQKSEVNQSEKKSIRKNVAFAESPTRNNQSIDTVKYENQMISPVANRTFNQNQTITLSEVPVDINNHAKTVVTLHSEENSPEVKTPAQNKQQVFTSHQRPVDSLEQNLQMKYSMTQDSAYKVQWDPEILADLKGFK